MSQVWSWGSGKFGCLGLGDDESRWFPSRIPLFAESQPATVETVSAGKWHVLCLTHKTHEVYAWGLNNWGQASSHLFPWLSYKKACVEGIPHYIYLMYANPRHFLSFFLLRRQSLSPASRQQLFRDSHVRRLTVVVFARRSSNLSPARNRRNQPMRAESRGNTMGQTGKPVAGLRRI